MRRSRQTHVSKLVFTLVLVALISLSTHALARGVIGAHVTDRTAIRASMGLPSVEFALHIPVNSMFEIAPKIDFYYGLYNIKSLGDFIGDWFGAEFKIALYQSSRLSAAFFIDFAFVLNYKPAFAFGIQLGTPAVKISYDVTNSVSIGGSFQVPIMFLVHPGFVLSVPILFGFNTEFDITDQFGIHVLFNLGPDIYKAKDLDAHVGFGLRFAFGLHYKF